MFIFVLLAGFNTARILFSMNNSTSAITRLFSIRNSYGKNLADQKVKLLQDIENRPAKTKKDIQLLNGTLLFLLAYPDNTAVYKQASRSLKQLEQLVRTNKRLKQSSYNSGITHTHLCASFSFEIVKWMRANHPEDTTLNDIEADEGQVQSILSVVMPKVESEIMQDGNASWKPWLQQSMQQDETLLDRMIAVFDESHLRPEVKDELWGALGINVEIYFSKHTCLPVSLFTPYYHRSLINRKSILLQPYVKPVQVKLSKEEAEQVIQCGRIVLMRQLREIDPISFTSARLASYYQLARGLSVALMGMVPERRHPIDSYMGYVVFKNGLPVAYAGSWILFDSARIGLNIFPEYRGGESAYIFQQVLSLHKEVYKLNRFTVDPYQLGKDNADGIHSGAFWVYHHAGFRPINMQQKKLAEAEAKKVVEDNNYRTSAKVLKILANSRMEWVMNKKAVWFDATDISRTYARIVKEQFNNDRKEAEVYAFKKLAVWLQLKDNRDEQVSYVLQNWCVLLFNKKMQLPKNAGTKKMMKELVILKANGREELYIKAMQQFGGLRDFIEEVVKQNTEV